MRASRNLSLSRRDDDVDGAGELEHAFAQFGDVRKAADSEEPILAPGPRAALYGWLTEIRHAEELTAVNVMPRRSALLYGPPGTGKTTMAHHLAARLGLPLVCLRAENIQSKWVNQTGEQIGQLFTLIDRYADQAVFFFDEFESLAYKRSGEQASDKERGSYLNILLRRFERSTAVRLAATNRQDQIDPAMWRRFDMQISVDLPGEDERFAILKRYAAPFEPSDDALEMLTDWTAGASPALLRALMENMKRSLVIWPKLRRDPNDVRAVVEQAVLSVAPPEEIRTPPLWAAKLDTAESRAALAALGWPWAKAA